MVPFPDDPTEPIQTLVALGWLHAGVETMERASRPGADAELLAAGEIANALHNLPYVLGQHLERGWASNCGFGPTALRRCPPEVAAHYDAFFVAGAAQIERVGPVAHDDTIFDALHWLFIDFRVWISYPGSWWRSLFRPESAAAIRRRYYPHWEGQRASCHGYAAVMQVHLDRWLAGEAFSRDDFVADGGYWFTLTPPTLAWRPPGPD